MERICLHAPILKIFDFLEARFFQSIGLGMESSPKISQPKRCKDVQNKILPSTPPIKKLGFLRTAHNTPKAPLSYISFTLEQFSVPQTSKLVKSRLVLHCHRIEGTPTGQRGPAFFVRLRSPTHRSQFLILVFFCILPGHALRAPFVQSPCRRVAAATPGQEIPKRKRTRRQCDPPSTKHPN